MNKVLITGNITNIYDNGESVKVSIADNYKESTTFIGVIFYNENSKSFIRKYIEKGDHVETVGRIGTYKDSVGAERMVVYGLEIAFDGYRNPHKRKNIFQDITNDELITEAETLMEKYSEELEKEESVNEKPLDGQPIEL
jgi:RPA family protein